MQAADEQYIADMRYEARVRREQARDKEGDARDWLLKRAAFFDACANEVEAKLKAAQNTAVDHGLRRPERWRFT